MIFLQISYSNMIELLLIWFDLKKQKETIGGKQVFKLI